ncbi:MAG: hypothetical protein ACXWV9_09885 [Flavisolibacter sp.]
MQEVDEKGEKNGKEKNEKEYIPHASLIKSRLPIKQSFEFYSCAPVLSPVLDHLTPPPDVII